MDHSRLKSRSPPLSKQKYYTPRVGSHRPRIKTRKDPNKARASSEPEARRERQRAARHAARHHHYRRRRAAEPARVAPRTHGQAHLPNDAQPRPEQKAERKPGAEAAQRPRRKQQKDDHDETARAARPLPDPSNDPPLELAVGSLISSGTEKCHCSSVIRNARRRKEDLRRSIDLNGVQKHR